ncbi:MAG: SDR family NAD(P)-dependent oxidoreductase [Chloroflexota bacterium]
MTDFPDPKALLDFTGETILVTGAGGGIGAGIAKRFAAAGATVAVHYRSNADGATAVVDAIASAGATAQAFSADLTDAEAVTALFDTIREAIGQVSVLVNNAGIYPTSPLMDMTADEWDAMMAANLRSVFLTTQAAARSMQEYDDGAKAIVNIASIEGTRGTRGHSHYATSKAAVIAHTRAAALELGEDGIRVNAVSPGLIYRDGIEEGFPEGVAQWREHAPLTRLGTPEDVADACLFLASPAARWITGVNLDVDGGMLLRPFM